MSFDNLLVITLAIFGGHEAQKETTAITLKLVKRISFALIPSPPGPRRGFFLDLMTAENR